ncbi:MAG: putative Co/Zn/Cd efflux system rane fusion protein [Variovorax sp.]|nr:putative Co/Zn/Cd efflux system rane fusion protein [Variovorax sp.]
MNSLTPYRRHLWLLPLIAILAGVTIQLRPTLSLAKAAPSAPQPIPVTVASAQKQNLPLWLDAIGTVTSLNAVTVRPRVDGQLQEVNFTEGQHVKAGELLAVIDPRPLQTTLTQSQAMLAQEEAKLASYQVDLKRASALAAAGAGPAQTVDTLRAQAATQTATVQAAKAAVDSAKLQLSFTRVVSPVDGRAGQRLVPVGSMVHATDVAGLVTVTQMNPIWVTFSVPQDVLPSVLRQSASKPLKVAALERDNARPLAEGELVFVDSQVTSTNGQIQLKARFDNIRSTLWPGGLVAVRMLLQTQADATVVPQAAVQQGSSGAFVYVSNAQHAAEVRPVIAGDVVNGMQWIRSGLQPGETVVTQGQSRLAAGLPLAETPQPASQQVAQVASTASTPTAAATLGARP